MSKIFQSLALAIAAFLSGGSDGYAAVYQEFESEVRQIASCKLDREHWDLVEDVVAESFLAAYESSESFSWDGTVEHFRNWLHGIARNRCRRIHQRRRDRREVSLNVSQAEGVERGCREFVLCDAKDEAETKLSQLSLFDERGERILRLRFITGLSIRQVAELLGVEGKTVSNKVALTLSLLRSICFEQEAS